MHCTSRYFYAEDMDIILNKIAIWGALGMTVLSKKQAPLGQSYLVEGSAAYQKATKPLYRYAKGYSIKKGKSVINFCLFVRTFSDNDKAVEKELDACAKSLNSEEILEALTVASMSNFTYTDTFLKGAK